MREEEGTILTINIGSSSIKSSLFRLEESEELLYKAEMKNIGSTKGQFVVTDSHNKTVVDEKLLLTSHADALEIFFEWMRTHGLIHAIHAIGHRLVHGGEHFLEPQQISKETLDQLKNAIAFDPLHLPIELQGIEIVQNTLPDVPQVVCFDTTFHRHLPTHAKMFPLPHTFFEKGIYRYGFHGLSYEFIMHTLPSIAGEDEAKGKIIIAHLGSGASMAAVQEGQCLDTTMGFTSTGGLIMATRCGDIDPGLLVYLMTEEKLSGNRLRWMLNHESGMRGISGISSDMKELLSKEKSHSSAALAIEMFCMQASKFIGAFSSVLNGLDTLVFTGGIGENASPIRERICSQLNHLGIEIDTESNEMGSGIISEKNSHTTVRVMKTNEEAMIAKHTRHVITKSRLSSGLF